MIALKAAVVVSRDYDLGPMRKLGEPVCNLTKLVKGPGSEEIPCVYENVSCRDRAQFLLKKVRVGDRDDPHARALANVTSFAKADV